MKRSHSQSCVDENVVRFVAGDYLKCICDKSWRCPDCQRFSMPIVGDGQCGCTVRFKGLCVDCDCTEVSLEECATLIGPAFVYTLHIHPRELVSKRNMLRKIAADVLGNPFAPYVNLETDATERTEWWLEANGKSWGSRGA